MKIPVDRLSETPAPFAFEGDLGWWQRAVRPERGLVRAPLEPFRFRVEAHRMGDDLYIEGVAEAALQLECSRCLARYRQRLREPFRLVLEPAGDRSPADPEAAAALSQNGMCLGDEIETGWYRGSEVDLGSFLAELVSLALPVQPLCREDCAGLCPCCGADLATGGCGCEPAKPDSPFAVLAALRDGPTGGQS